jgi:hypothetical protein
MADTLVGLHETLSGNGSGSNRWQAWVKVG